MDWSQATRGTYIGLTPVEKVLFYLLSLGSLGIIVYWYWRRLQGWRQGVPDSSPRPLRERIALMLTFAFGQRKLPRHKFGGLFHLPLYFGFLVLFIGTTLLFFAEWGKWLFHFWFHQGLYFLVYELLLDLFGLGVLFGCVLALYRRHLQRPPSLSRHPLDALSVWLLLLIVLTGYLLEAARIAYEPRPAWVEGWSFVGNALSPLFKGIHVVGYKLLWWVHAVLIAAWLASLAFNRVRHLLLAPIVAFYKPPLYPNVPSLVEMEQIEKEGRIGANALTHLPRWHLMSLDACMGCGRCERACPAVASGKVLNPKLIVEKLREAMEAQNGSDLRKVISDEELFACTTCGACQQECPVLIEHPILIMEMRRHRVAEGNLRGTAATTLQRLMNQSNPWGLPPAERLQWAEGLGVKTVRENPHFEVLFWVGCAGSYDGRGQQIARAIVKLLQKAGVNFAVLGPEERCTGDTARRLGEELLFQELAMGNVQTLNQAMVQEGALDGSEREPLPSASRDQVGSPTLGKMPKPPSRTILTMCPHCFHTIKNEYPQFGGHYEVVHHSQFLAELIEQGRLPSPKSALSSTVVFHDPCYLARVNGVQDAPRRVLSATPLRVLEAPRNGDKTFCCGAGGGRMWFEEPPQQRPGMIRAEELLQTGAQTIAVGCPFCMIMVSDSVKAKTEQVPVKDLAEILWEQLEENA